MLPDWLSDSLQLLRRQRDFRPNEALRAKSRLINDYMAASGLSAVVVGVSGGVDSALVLALADHARRQPGSPIRRLVAALIPMFTSGATSQDRALERGREVAERYGAEIAHIDLSQSKTVLQEAVDRGCGRQGQPWAAGQLVSYLRTPALYYLAANLAEAGYPALLWGTTNRDEGAYIGFFGKASDGMVDLQPISDLHKSEVYQLARLLEVPRSVLEAVPSGDTFDGRVDEQMIGAPYDFLELYQGALERGFELPAQAADWVAAVEDLHRRNLHKYLANSPAVHLDCYPRAVPGGWRSEAYPPLPPGAAPQGRLVGEFSLPDPAWEDRQPEATGLDDLGDSARLWEAALDPQEVDWLRAQLDKVEWVAVNRHGNRQDFDPARDPVGSWRASCWSPALAEALWQRLAPGLTQLRVFEPDTPSDAGGHAVWRAMGVNPAMRFIRYAPGGVLVPHYDAGYDYGDGRRHTLMSLVVYLSDGGQTRFLLEPQRHRPTAMRNHQDWTRLAREEEVLTSVDTRAGRALAFDHRLLHDSTPWEGPGERLLLRTDIVFERCGLQPIAPRVTGLGRSGDPGLDADPYYGPLFSLLGSRQAVEEAGYFAESPSEPGPWREDPLWMVTPLHKLEQRLQQAPPEADLAVLVTTGAFCPVHPGHVAMMERARGLLESQGTFVVGGYLSPSHDEYVGLKCGPAVPGAAHRLHLCQQMVAESDWLLVDPWESQVAPVAVNFTVVMERLGAYLSRHLRCHRPLRVVYVFGSDNARFALTFGARGHGVCIPRCGYEQLAARYASDPRVARDRVLFDPGPGLPNTASSKVRQGQLESLTEEVRALWLSWIERPVPAPGRFYVRDEGDWALASLAEVVGWELLRPAWQRFVDRVEGLLAQAFAAATAPDVPRQLEVQRLLLSQQAVRGGSLGRVLSLDPCLPGEANLGVSRLFPLADSSRGLGLVARPGWPPLEQQLDSIAPGQYVLMDDDRVTGETERVVRSWLPRSVELVGSQCLCQVEAPGPGGLCDLVDARDFLLGAREGGLAVQLPAPYGVARAPYLLPYVQPCERLSIPLSRQQWLSAQLWQLNLEFFENTGLQVGHAWCAFQPLARLLGLAEDTPLAEVARWHLQRLAASGERWKNARPLALEGVSLSRAILDQRSEGD